MAPSHALVLGGGGLTGIAWELGLLLGLHRAGIDLAGFDTIVGTSAGSVVGSLLATGNDLEAAVAQQLVGNGDEQPINADMTLVMQAFAVLFDRSRHPREARAHVGAMARDAAVGDEASYLRRFALFAELAWPSRPQLRLTGVDIASGEPAVWDHQSGVRLRDAIAASCAVPCVFPPVTIGGQRYMDGGVRSPINADLVAGARGVVVVAPLVAFMHSWPDERAKLGDAEVLLIGPDAASTDAIGVNVMDGSRRSIALQAGLAQASSVVAATARVLAA